MTIEQRQKAAEVWATAYADWLRADEQAAHYDNLRIQAGIRADAARKELVDVACVSATVPTRIFNIPTANYDYLKLVKVTFSNVVTSPRVELLQTEPNG